MVRRAGRVTRPLRLESVNGAPVVEFRVVDGHVERRALRPDGRKAPGGSPWTPLTRAELLEMPRDGLVWEWLREQGVRRPSPPGRSGPTTPEDARPGVRMTLRLSEEAAARLDRLRGERTRTEAIEALLLMVVESDARR